MAYNTKELEKEALRAIKEHKLFFVSDVIAYLPCSKQTFYDHKLDQSDDLKRALEANRIHTKVKLRKKWENTESAPLQIALMKLLADDEERKRISQGYVDVTSAGEKLSTALVEFVDGDKPKSKSTDTK